MKLTHLFIFVFGMISLISMSMVRAEVLRVDPNDPNDPNAYLTIEAAVEAAASGDTVMVADGLYEMPTNLIGTMIHIQKSLIICSEGGAGQCIIQGRDYSQIFRVDEAVLNVTIQGFTIRQSRYSQGAAIYGETAGQINVVDCNFEDNTAFDRDGGAIYMERGQIHVSNCHFVNNTANDDGGAVACNENATLLMEDCVLISNHSEDNGGALFCRDTQVTLRRCRLYGNQCDSNGGAGYIRDGRSHFQNCIFSGNQGNDDGGAVYVRDAWAMVVHCSIYGNQANGQGGGLASNDRSSIIVYGSVLWDNQDRDGHNASAQVTETTATVAYDCIQNWPPQDTILTLDPLFVDADGLDNVVGTIDDDLHLQASSSCIDAGLYTTVSWPFELDLERQGRLKATAVDLGALEYGSSPADANLYTPEIVAPVVVSEVYTHSPNSSDWIEIHNTTDQPVNVGGWVLEDGYYYAYGLDGGQSRGAYVFEPNTILWPGEYRVLTEGQELPFAFSYYGERLSFVSGVAGISTGYQEMYAFNYALIRESLIRHVNSMGLLEFVPSVNPTPADENVAPKVGPIVISEIKHDRYDDPYQYIELLNIGSDPVTVFHSDGQDYSIEGSVSYDHQETNDVVLDPNQRVVITNYPELLRSSTSLPEGVQVVGPFDGELPRVGGVITLIDPHAPAVAEEVLYNVGIGLYEDDWEAFWLKGVLDSRGQSLERINPNAYGNDAANWQLALPTMGY